MGVAYILLFGNGVIIFVFCFLQGMKSAQITFFCLCVFMDRRWKE